MDKRIKNILWIGMILSLTLIDFSAVCAHRMDSGSSFGYGQFRQSENQVQTEGLVVPGLRPAPADAPIELSWRQLADVSYELKYNKKYKTKIYYPVFGDQVKRLNGKTIQISGYMIPLDVEAGLYAISRNTYAACFFCGAAGVESVISLKFSKPPDRYKTDQYCTIQGQLELNSTNVDDFIYILHHTENAKS